MEFKLDKGYLEKYLITELFPLLLHLQYMILYIDKPNEFKTILNNQIEKYDEERIEKQARKMAEAMK